MTMPIQRYDYGGRKTEGGGLCLSDDVAAVERERDELIKMHALACADGAELARVATRRAEERKILEAERDALAAANLSLTTEIGTLRTEMARLRDAQRWIPCSERMPSERQEVFVAFLISGMSFIGRCYWYENITGAQCWATDSKMDDKKVTHWMPLPAPPGQEKP